MQVQYKKPDSAAGARNRIEKAVLGFFLLAGKAISTFWDPASKHARDFNSAPNIPDGKAEDLVPVSEFFDPDESIVINDLTKAFSGDCLQNKKNAGHNVDHEDLHWGYTKGLVEGHLSIQDVDALPESCRIGLFKGPGDFAVVARPNFLRDEDSIQISRLSLKLRTDFDVPNVYTLEGKAQELDLLLSEGIRWSDTPTRDQDGQGFFFRDARQLRYMHGFNASPVKGLFSLLRRSNGIVFETQQNIMKQALDCLYTETQSQKNWAEKDYYSAGPYRLGDHLVKFALRSCQSNHARKRPRGNDSLSKDHQSWFQEWEKKGDVATFDVCVQLARFGAIKPRDPSKGDPCKAIMATEYTDLVWDESVSAFTPVGTLSLGVHSASTKSVPWYFATRDRWYPEQSVPTAALRFNAWNTLPEMEPVGQLFRARKSVHAHHRETRMRHAYGAQTDPKAFCPVR